MTESPQQVLLAHLRKRTLLAQWRGTGKLQNIEPSSVTIHRIDEFLFIYVHVVDLHHPFRRSRRRRRNKEAYFLQGRWGSRPERLTKTVHPHSAVEEAAHDGVTQDGGGWQRHILMNVMGAKPSPAAA